MSVPASENPFKNITSEVGGKDNVFEDFTSFITKGNILDLAIGSVLGSAFTGVVTALSQDMLVPIVGSLINIDLSNDFFIWKQGQSGKNITYKTAKEAEDDKAVVIKYGKVLEKGITFIVQSLALYVIIRAYKTTRERLGGFY